ncbi:UNVERIFIED_CONTAM: tyrosine-type recombinase/integrase [Bacillus sp. ATCC 13368]
MDTQVMKLLKKHSLQQNKIIIQNRDHYIDENCLHFTRGISVNAKTVSNTFKKLSNIHKEITLHSFRHTHTSLPVKVEVGLKEIQQRLGHTDIQTTMNI